MKKLIIVLICGFLLAPLSAWGQNWIEPYTDKDGTHRMAAGCDDALAGIVRHNDHQIVVTVRASLAPSLVVIQRHEYLSGEDPFLKGMHPGLGFVY